MTAMPCRDRIAAYLDEQGVPFRRELHRMVFTTQAVALAEQEEIVVQPGCHDETFRLRYADYVRLIQPVALPIAQQG